MTSLLEAADVSLAQIGSEGVIVAVDRDPLSQCCGLAPPPLATEHGNVGQVAVAFGIIQSVANEEFAFCAQGYKVCFKVTASTGLLVDGNSGIDFLSSCLK